MSKCWAYNKDKMRCDNEAGHEGKHAIMTEWSDDECFDPTYQPAPAPLVINTNTNTLPVPPLVEAMNHDDSKCIGCGHRHKNGECKCGCYEFIG